MVTTWLALYAGLFDASNRYTRTEARSPKYTIDGLELDDETSIAQLPVFPLAPEQSFPFKSLAIKTMFVPERALAT